jgi:hypothetical protein
MNEKRAAMISKLKAVEKEAEALALRRDVAEAYLGKQADRLRAQLAGHRLKLLKTEVRSCLFGVVVWRVVWRVVWWCCVYAVVQVFEATTHTSPIAQQPPFSNNPPLTTL